MVRKNQEQLSDAERLSFVNALLTLKENGTYDQFVRQHIDRANGDSDFGIRIGHRSPGFLPWHRQFLLEFERELQAVDPAVSLPYWDWTSAGANSGLWADDFMGPNGIAGQNWRVVEGPFAERAGNWPVTVRADSGDHLRRNFGAGGSFRLPSSGEVNSVLSMPTYDSTPWNSASGSSFRNYLEGFRGPNLHNRVHNWVNGTMAGFGSPNDPVFWLHHCNVDRLWSQWQGRNPGATYDPRSDTANVPSIDRSMPPWENRNVTPRSVLDHTRWYMYQ